MLRTRSSFASISCTNGASSSRRTVCPPSLSLRVKCMTIFMTVGFPVMMSFRAKTFDLWVKGEGEGGGGGGGGELKNNVFKF